MPRRQAILETLLIFVVFCVQGAWPVPEVNEPYYLGKAIHYWNPQWASGDWFLQTPDTHIVFYFSVGWLSRLLSATALAWTLRVITWALLAWSWQRLSGAVVPRPWAAPLTATLFLFLLQHYNMAGEWVVGGAEAKGFSFVFVFLALEAMVGGYWNRMWLLLGVATAFHALVGGWAAIAAGAVWMLSPLSLWERVRVRAAGLDDDRTNSLHTPSPPAPLPKGDGRLNAWIAPLAAALLALPGILPALLMNYGIDAHVASEAAIIYVFKRFPHHLDPVKMWNDGFTLPYLIMIGAWLLLWRTANDRQHARRLRGFIVAALLLALIGTGFGLLGLHHKAMAAGWMRFYWFRLADVAVPLGLAIFAVSWFLQRKMRVALALSVAVAIFHVADCAVIRLFADPPFIERQVDGAAWRAACLWATGRPLRPLFPRQPRADRLRDYGAWLDICRWIADPRHTPPDARFIIPRAGQTFKWYAGRGEVVNWKEAPQDAVKLRAWDERIRDIYATGKAPPEDYYFSLADAGPARLRQLAEKYQADYIVTQIGGEFLPLPKVYWNDAFVVYKMR